MTSFKWTTSNDTRVWNTQILKIVNVSRNDAMLYLCEVANLMKETGTLLQISVPDNETTVKEFFVAGFADIKPVTIKETENVHLHCNAESNPRSDIVIKNQTGYVMKSGSDVNNLNHLLLSVTCLDAGTYTCSGSNGYGTRGSMKQLTLYVNCAPMPSPYLQIKTSFWIAEYHSAVFSFKKVAYPKPSKEDFHWFRWYDNEWKPLKNNHAFQIDTVDLESNLTVYNVNKTVYGIYKLMVKNIMGQYEQMFLLQPEECQLQCICPESNTKTIITGVVLGVVIAALAFYAGHVTFLMKRTGFHEGRAQSRNQTDNGNITNLSTYANVAFSTDVTGQQEREPGISEYTTLEEKFRNENMAYETLDTAS
ncbi:neural cell adhesion molecule 1-like [Ruditapes philippinarum]|uniref:neural cell adhesion molecule 1-like n=1 Tax=Ruditapes philippinarum TaxID=129788 RepID=UPI00295B9021|nr:neural cell adhesion molecule 1-like [Ruditapes philippinarum]